MLGALLSVTAACSLSAWTGYTRGYSKAEAEGVAALETLKGEHAAAYAEAMRVQNDNLREETARALSSTAALAVARETHVREKNAMRARIAAVTANSRHVFSADFVRLYNEAIAAAGSPVSGTGHSSGTDGKARSGRTADGGFPGKGVTETDILAHITYYGERCRNIEAQTNAWIDYAEGWK